MPVAENDIFEEAAKKLTAIMLKRELKRYYKDQPEKYVQVSRFKKGESGDVPNTLLHEILTYWRANFDVPPEIAVDAAEEHDPIQMEAIKMNVKELRDFLVEAFTGDSLKCNRIRKTTKGNLTPDSLVIFVEFKYAGSNSSF
jgi:hypothetical protein